MTFPRSINAASFKPSFAEDVRVVVLTLALRCSLTNVNLTSVSRMSAVPLNGSLIFIFKGVDSGISIVSVNWTLRPTNCHSVDLWKPNLKSSAWE